MGWSRSRWVLVAVSAVALVVLVAVTVSAARWATRPAESTLPAPVDSGGSSSLAPSPTAQPCTSETLVLGSLMPQTGDLAFLGPPGAAAVSLALADIDAAGGVLGSPVRYDPGDSGGAGSGLALPSAQAQIADGVQAIVGPIASAVTLEVIDEVTDAGVVLVSPANTSPALSDYPDAGLYFRTVPSDAVQGAALAEVARGLGLTRAATLARVDAYGVGVQQAFEARFAALGGTVEASASYDPESASLAQAVEAVAAATPDVIVVVGFEESARIVQELVRQGVGPQQVQLLLAEGGVSRTAYADLPGGTMRGVLGAVPSRGPVVGRKAFHQRLLDTDPSLTTFAYAAEAYDAAVLVALAAEYAGCAEGPSIAEAIPLVANANPGSAVCGTYADCLEIIGRGGQPNYEGVSGPGDLSASGEPVSGRVDIVRFGTNTRYRTLEVVGPVEVATP